MPYNLIEEPWIPVKRSGGKEEWICPWQITDHTQEDVPPVVGLNATRPDFDGALLQFLIGLVQTAFLPARDRQWRSHLQDPPSPETLRQGFSDWGRAFNLNGDGPRFQQDLEEIPDAKEKPISYLLVDSPSDNALRENKDHFVKDRSHQRYCPACTATALQALQVNAPQGGRGHRTSLRGGGPVSTVITGRNLWHTIWLNVLPRSTYGEEVEQEEEVFPWLAPTRTSEDGTVTTPEDGHPLQAYWGMPRRLYLEEPEEGGSCDLCGREAEQRYGQYRTTSHGVNYEGAWEHPLTPHRVTDDGELRPFHSRQEGFSYRYWRGLAAGRSSENARSAQVVQAFYDRYGRKGYERLDPIFKDRPRLRVFGYEADRTKMRAWHESLMPIYPASEELRSKISRLAGQLIQAADILESILIQALRRGLYGTPSSSRRGTSWDVEDRASRDQTFFENASVQFWQETEAAFFKRLGNGVEEMKVGRSPADLTEEKTAWLEDLREEATRLFDDRTGMGRFRSADPKALGVARQELRRFSGARASRVKDALDLPEEEPA
jgi:CRISPR system Cascade subunit CasA